MLSSVVISTNWIDSRFDFHNVFLSSDNQYNRFFVTDLPSQIITRWIFLNLERLQKTMYLVPIEITVPVSSPLRQAEWGLGTMQLRKR